MTMRKKITVVGAGNVGSTTGLRLIERELGDVVLTDVLEGVPAGKALDMLESMPIAGADAQAMGISTGGSGSAASLSSAGTRPTYEQTAGSDIVVFTAGFPRRPGMSRNDLLQANYDVIKTCVTSIVRHSPEAILIMVTNPLDAMVQAAYRISGFPSRRVIGMAGILDSARMSTFVAEELHVSVENVNALVLGGHGDTMVPLPRHTTVAGIPLPELLPRDRIDAIIERTRNGGAEIVNLLKTGGAYYAPSAAVVQMVDAIVKDKKQILPCAAYLEGEYGLRDVFVGVPVKLGARGLEQIIELDLDSDERAALHRSAGAVRELVAALGVQ